VKRIASGEAILTDAFALPAQHVIHAVGPRYLDGNRGEAETLAQTYRSICALVEEYTITSVSIPSIGTGTGQLDTPYRLVNALRVSKMHIGFCFTQRKNYSCS
jgi:O-acetyl-ADP-ribose deacetylase (regulator of RNase III)